MRAPRAATLRAQTACAYLFPTLTALEKSAGSQVECWAGVRQREVPDLPDARRGAGRPPGLLAGSGPPGIHPLTQDDPGGAGRLEAAVEPGAGGGYRCRGAGDAGGGPAVRPREARGTPP